MIGLFAAAALGDVAAAHPAFNDDLGNGLIIKSADFEFVIIGKRAGKGVSLHSHLFQMLIGSSSINGLNNNRS